jgi:superfamily II DNA or RNA helicase
MLDQWPTSPVLRRWQARAFNKFMAHASDDFLAVATPGAGKTRFALRVMHEMLARGIVRFVVIVVPSEHLKQQWARAAAKVDIHLDPNWSNGSGVVAKDFHGIVATYAQVASNAAIHRRLCAAPTLAVFDEIHHAGRERAWGEGIREAYDGAVKRLLLSGTPFRSDGFPIPYVRYVDGKSQADFSYTYAEALSDDICRPILFPSYEGQMKWYSRGRTYEATFRDELSDDRAAQRLRTAVDAHGEWVRETFRDADKRLTEVRETHPDAGGLIVVMNREHATLASAVLKEVTGQEATVATIDDPNAADTIEEYARSDRRWIIAIRMISEGSDIPRLRVGVYATNVVTELFFRQFAGRFARVIEGMEDQNAYIFIPRDEAIVGFAQQIKEERDHQLEQEAEAARREANAGVDGPSFDDKTLSLFLAVSSTGHPDDVIVDQDTVSQAEIREADEVKKKYGSREDPAILARIIREIRGNGFTVRAEAKATKAEPPPLHVQKDRLRRIIRRLAAQVVEMTDERYEFRDVYIALMKRDGVGQDQATIDQLNSRIEFLQEWAKRLSDGG